MAHLTASVLRHVRHDLHTTWDYALRSTMAASIIRGSWPTKTVRELLDERASDVVTSDMHSISYTKHD